MTVLIEDSFVTWTGDGAQTEFTVPFSFPATAALVVTLAGVVQTLGVDYTVTGGADDGVVTFAAPPDDGDEVLIERTVELTQPTAFHEQGPFSPVVHELALDHVVYGVQQVARDVATLRGDLEAGLEEADDDLVALDTRLDQLVLDVGAAQVIAGGIGTAQLADGSVTTPKLAEGAVTTAKLADGSVTAAKRAAETPQVSAALEAWGTTADSWTDSGLSVSITARGRPVFVTVAYGDPGFGESYVGCSLGSPGFALFAIDMDGTFIHMTRVHSTAGGAYLPPGILHAVATPAPGAHTFKLYAKRGDASSSAQIKNVRLLAYEL